MIIVVKKDCDKKELKNLTDWVKDQGLKIDESKGANNLILGLVGDTSKIDMT